MKLFWKLMTGMVGIMIAAFAVFGTVLLHTSFRTSLNKETENGLEEMRVLQYAFLAAAEGLEESYNLGERTVQQLAKSVASNVGDSRNEVCIYDAQGESVYPIRKKAGELFELLSGAQTANDASDSDRQAAGHDGADYEADGNCVWRLTDSMGEHYMEALARLECGGQIYYLEVRRNMNDIYEGRESNRRTYRATLLMLAAVAALLSSIFAAGFTAPVRRLSLATRSFSRGRYEKRVKPKGNDEIAGLMNDFNKMANELENNFHTLEENARRQEEFTGAFAHELKTPLTSMIGYGEMLMTMDLDKEDRRQAADYIYRESRRLERLAYKMMELIHIGKLGIETGPVSAEELERRLRRLTAARVWEKEIRFFCSFERATLCGDMDLLLSLLGNLVDNSCKACESGGSIRVEGSLAEEPAVTDGQEENPAGGTAEENRAEGGQRRCYRICVVDDGRGMPEDEVDRVTEAFYMVDKSRARREGGAGLGMAICSRIIEAHGARWEIASALGKGTTVTMYFRLMEPQAKRVRRGEEK